MKTARGAESGQNCDLWRARYCTDSASASPLGEHQEDSSAYDFIIEHKGKLLRVQVKSTTHARYHSYVCNFHGHKNRRYTAEQIDFVAAYIVPKDIWFIFPIAVGMKVHSSAVLSPHMKVSKYGEYQEAWYLMRGEGDSTVGRSPSGD